MHLALQIADIIAAAAQANPPYQANNWYNVSLPHVRRAVAIVHFASHQGVQLPSNHVLAAFTLNPGLHAGIRAALPVRTWIEDLGVEGPPAPFDRWGLYFTVPPTPSEVITLQILSVVARGNCLGMVC